MHWLTVTTPHCAETELLVSVSRKTNEVFEQLQWQFPISVEWTREWERKQPGAAIHHILEWGGAIQGALRSSLRRLPKQFHSLPITASEAARAGRQSWLVGYSKGKSMRGRLQLNQEIERTTQNAFGDTSPNLKGEPRAEENGFGRAGARARHLSTTARHDSGPQSEPRTPP